MRQPLEKMASPKNTIKLFGDNWPLLMLGLAFMILGVIMAVSGMAAYQVQTDWKDAVTTTGRVILTEWKQSNNENRLQVRYAYKDDRGVIYHNGAVLARRLGKLNLEPGSAVVVEYKPEDHSRSMLQLQLGSNEWVPVLVLGGLEVIAGLFFVAACFRRVIKSSTAE